MSMLLSNRSEYYKTYDRSTVPVNCRAGVLKSVGNRIIVFSPVLWVVIFALMTVLVNFLVK